MKFHQPSLSNSGPVSLPLRERGLKSDKLASGIRGGSVAHPAGAWIEIPSSRTQSHRRNVAHPAGAWIEIFRFPVFYRSILVAPPAGARIEIPMQKQKGRLCQNVAPPAGAWIEITCSNIEIRKDTVAPPAGAWIEMWQVV